MRDRRTGTAVLVPSLQFPFGLSGALLTFSTRMECAVGIQFALIDDLCCTRYHLSALGARDPFHRPLDLGIERRVLVLVVPFEMMNRDLHGDLPPMRDVGPSIARSLGHGTVKYAAHVKRGALFALRFFVSRLWVPVVPHQDRHSRATTCDSLEVPLREKSPGGAARACASGTTAGTQSSVRTAQVIAAPRSCCI